MDTPPFPPELEPPQDPQVGEVSPLVGPSLSGFINGIYFPIQKGGHARTHPLSSPELAPPLYPLYARGLYMPQDPSQLQGY